MRKRICPVVLILISVILLIGVTGCMDTSKNTKKDTITIDSAKAEVLAALSQKYGRTFECVANGSPSILNNEYTFCVVEKGYDYDGFGFKAYYNPNSDIKVSDGYFGIIIRDELSGLLLDERFATEAKVFVKLSSTIFDNNLKTTSTLEDALKIYNTLRVYYYVFLPNGSEYDIGFLKSNVPNDIVGGMINYYEIPRDIFLQLSYDSYVMTVRNITNGEIVAKNKGSFNF